MILMGAPVEENHFQCIHTLMCLGKTEVRDGGVL